MMPLMCLPRRHRWCYYVCTMMLLLLAVILAWNHRVAARRKQSLCGVWEAVLPRGRLCIRAAEQGYEILLPTSGGIRRYPLEGCRTPYFCKSGRRVYLHISQSGRELLLLPGDSYRRVEENVNQSTPNHDQE